MLQKACKTLELNTYFIRPTSVADKKLIVEACLVAKTRSQLVLEGKVNNPGGKLRMSDLIDLPFIKSG